MSDESQVESRTTNPISVSVLILGAGMAGISAGLKLTELGITDFMILEAQNRIGGRIYSIEFAGLRFEAGPVWLHGKVSNPLTKLAQNCDLMLRPSEYNSIAMRSDTSEDLSDQVAEPLQHISEISDAVFRDLRRNSPEVDKTCREKWQEHGWYPRTIVEKAVDSYWFEFQYGLPPERFSMLGDYKSEKSYEDDSLKGDFLMVSPGGFTRLLTALTTRFLADNDSRLRFCQVVKLIEWSGPRVVVTTQTGEVYTAAHAIVTFPNNVLVSGDVHFDPPLPQMKVASLRQVHNSNYSRIFVRFPDTFWDPADYILHASNRPGRLTVWQNAARCGLCPPHFPILIIHIVGPEAERIHRMTHVELVEEVTDVMRGMYPTTFRPPEEVRYVSLVDDPFARGAFSCTYAPLTQRTVEWLARNCGSLHFAGDGTTLEYNGYIQGAYLTGMWAAETISKLLHLSSKL